MEKLLRRAMSAIMFCEEIEEVPLRKWKSDTEIFIYGESVAPPEPKKVPEIIPIIPEAPKPHMVDWTPLDEVNAYNIKFAPRSEWSNIIDPLLSKLSVGKELSILRVLLFEIIRFSTQKDYSPKQIAIIVDIFMATHRYFTSSPWRTTDDTFTFFKETIFSHSIYDPPTSVRDFMATETMDIIEYFCTLYLPVLPLVRASLMTNYRLEMKWSASTGTKVKKLNPSESSEGHLITFT